MSDITVIQDDIRTRERKIQLVDSAIAKEKRNINSLLPISRLPTEVLSHIFTYVSLNCSDFPEIQESPYECMTVSQVCYNWRTVALATHSLWSTVYMNYLDGVALFLQRSGKMLLDVVAVKMDYYRMTPSDLPMHIRHGTTESSIMESMRLLLEQPQRIRSLNLKLSNHTLANALREVYQDGSTASSLRKIVLYDEDEDDLPDIFYPRHFPNLVHLELHRFCFVRHPTSLQFTTLETLIIHNADDKPYNHSSRCVLRELLYVLSSNPRIRVFKLLDEYCGERDPQPDEGAGELPEVTLSYLQEVKIHSDAACINLFLTRCTLPLSATVEFITSDCSTNTHLPSPYTYDTQTLLALRSIVASISKKSDAMSGLEITFRNLQDFTDQNLPPSPRRSDACAVTLVTCYSDSASGPDFVQRDRFQFNCPVRRGWANILSELVFLLPTSNISYLKLAALAPFSAVPACSEIFGYWIAGLIGRCSPRGLHTLHLAGPALFLTPFFLKYMEPLHDAHADSHMPLTHCQPTPLFYLLHTLAISNVRDVIMIRRNGSRVLDLGDVFDALRVQATRCRGTCGRFSTLILDQCQFRKGLLYELVDSIADIVGQRGRFTDNPSVMDFTVYPPTMPLLEPPANVTESEPLPDTDLDFPSWFHGILANTNQQEPQMTYWDARVPYDRVTLDFRGCSGIKIDESEYNSKY